MGATKGVDFSIKMLKPLPNPVSGTIIIILLPRKGRKEVYHENNR